MTLLIRTLLLCTFPFTFAYSQSRDSAKLVLHFFGSSTCGHCLEIKQKLLMPMMKAHGDSLLVQVHDIDQKSDMQLLIQMEKDFGVTTSSPQQLFFPDTCLSGYETIMKHGKAMILRYLSTQDAWGQVNVTIDTVAVSRSLAERVKGFTFWGITAAGIVDGINPCAIATMIFLISFLAMQKRKRTEVLVIGLCFTAAVYVTYVLIGLGAFRLLTMLNEFRLVSLIVKWGAVGVAAVIAVVSFWDAFSFKRSGKASDIKLQLPKGVKMQIHKVISQNLSGGRLIIGSIVTGFLVTLLEAVCTGQVYIPTIVLMTRQSGMRLRGWLLLLYYNLLFVAPLLIVMGMAWYGMKWNHLSKATQKHLPLLKVLLGIVMAALAVFLGVSL